MAQNQGLVESEKIITGVGVEKRPAALGDGTVFITVLGSFAGDFWHCAAAQILSEYQMKGAVEPFPFPNLRFVVCIVVFDTTKMIRGGQKMFEYIRSINLPCVLVEVDVPINTQITEAALNKLSGVDILQLWQKQQQDSHTKTFSEIRASCKAKNIGTGVNGGDERLVRHVVATTMIMQFIEYFGIRPVQTILAERLVRPEGASYHLDISALAQPQREQTLKDHTADPREQFQNRVLEEALERLNALRDAIESAKARFLDENKRAATQVLLFNYRRAFYYLQHNGSRSILGQVKRMAAIANTAVVVIPAMDDKYRQTEIKPAEDIVFDIYDKPDPPLYRYRLSYNGRALFWHLAAKYLQLPNATGGPAVADRTDPYRKDACILGLMGGRSGSMDIASFVGMRSLSWDEPLFAVDARKNGKKYSIPIIYENQVTMSGDGAGKPNSSTEQENKSGVQTGEATNESKKRKSPTGDRTRTSEEATKLKQRPGGLSGAWAAKQAFQILRLLNQRDLMHVSFLRKSELTIKKEGPTYHNVYELLEEEDSRLKQFLDPHSVKRNEMPNISLGVDANPGWVVSKDHIRVRTSIDLQQAYAILHWRTVLDRSKLGIWTRNLNLYAALAQKIVSGTTIQDAEANVNAEDFKKWLSLLYEAAASEITGTEDNNVEDEKSASADPSEDEDEEPWETTIPLRTTTTTPLRTTATTPPSTTTTIPSSITTTKSQAAPK